MLTSTLSDEQIYSALETTVDYFWERIHGVVTLKSSRDLEDPLLQKLSEQDLNERTAVAFFKAVYSYLLKNRLVDVNTSPEGVIYEMKQSLTESKKMDYCLAIFHTDEKYLIASYERSKLQPQVYSREPFPRKEGFSVFDKNQGGK